MKRTSTRLSDLDSSFLTVINERRAGCGGAVGDELCVLSALSASRCTGTIVIGESKEEAGKESEGVSKQHGISKIIYKNFSHQTAVLKCAEGWSLSVTEKHATNIPSGYNL